MKRIFFFVFFIFGILSIDAQISVDYNTQGDQAFREQKYQTARSWYSEGLDSCDIYSIQRMSDIWSSQPSMRESMKSQMQICFECLKKLATEKDPEAVSLLINFYRDGIGTEKDSTSANHWIREYLILKDFPVDSPNTIDDSFATKVKKKSLLSNRFSSFLTYTFSPTMPLGFTAGIYFDRVGGYVSYRMNLKSINAVYECNNLKVPAIEPENPFYNFNRERWHSRMITGGLMLPVLKNQLFVSLGGGYGKRDYYREIITDGTFDTGNNSEWCYNTEASYEGLTLEAGGMFIWKKLTVLGGVNSTRFKDFDVYIGLGLTF